MKRSPTESLRNALLEKAVAEYRYGCRAVKEILDSAKKEWRESLDIETPLMLLTEAIENGQKAMDAIATRCQDIPKSQPKTVWAELAKTCAASSLERACEHFHKEGVPLTQMQATILYRELYSNIKAAMDMVAVESVQGADVRGALGDA